MKTIFKRYVAYADKTKSVFAAQTCEETYEFDKTWAQNDNLRVGDYILLGESGKVTIMGELDFGETYRRPDPDQLFPR